MRYALLALFILLAQSVSQNGSLAHAGDRGARFQNLDQMIEDLNLRPYFRHNLKAKRQLKVAIFDNGFKGAKEQIGGTLPEFTEIHDGPVAVQGEEEAHGYYMAKIFYEVLTLGGKDDRYAPAEFHLYRTYGYSNLKAAVEDAIEREIDIVLYSQTWEYGGNFDGKGFINALVNRALNHGILWVNAAGNFGQTTFNSDIRTGKDDWVELPGVNHSVEVRCEINQTGKCPFRAVLSWNAFTNNVDDGTNKDLDFVLTDDTLRILKSANLTQKLDAGDQPGTSKYPREILTAELEPGLYYLRIKNRSKNFVSGKDKLRISVTGDFLSMESHDKSESLQAPADNPRVLSVGALDSEKSGISRKLRKPEVYANSFVSVTDKENFKGTSNSAAMVAAGVTILKSLIPDLSKDEIVKMMGTSIPTHGEYGQGLPLDTLGFFPTGNLGCFAPVSAEDAPDYLLEMIEDGGILVETSHGKKLFFDFDPISLMSGFYRRDWADILVTTPNGLGIYHRSYAQNLSREAIEVVQTPRNQVICSRSHGAAGTLPSWGKLFRLSRR